MTSVAADTKIRVGILDDTGRGLADLEKRFAAWGKHVDKVAAPVKTIEKSIDAIGRSVGLDKWTKAFSGIAGADQFGNVAKGISATASEVFGLSEAMSMGIGVMGGMATAAAASGVAITVAGAKWDDGAANMSRFSKGVGMSVNDTNELTAAFARMGVKGDAASSAIQGISQAALAEDLGDPVMGSIFQKWGLHLKYTKDGLIDVKKLTYDLADVAQKLTPQSRQQLAAIFGYSAAEPAMRQGSEAIKSREDAAIHLSPKDQAQADDDYDKWVHAGQIIDRWKSDIGRGFAHSTVGIAKWIDSWDHDQAPTAGPQRTIALPVSEFDAFVKRIEQQESGGRQFGRNGSPLISGKGAVGAMQMLPETAAKAAALAGVAFDPNRLATDRGYNEQLGRTWLKHLMDEYGGNETLAAAAYNAGEGVVNDWINGTDNTGKNPRKRHLGDPRRGEIDSAAFGQLIPFDETRNYVAATAQNVVVTVHFDNAPPGTSATAKAPGSDVKVTVATAMPHSG